MPSIHVFKRKWKDKNGIEQIAKVYSAQIRFGEPHKANFLRSTGKTNERDATTEARRIAREIEDTILPRRGVEILTLDEMCGQWYDEHGKTLRSEKDVKWQIEKLLKFISRTREVRELSNKDIHGFVQDAKAGGAGAVTINRCLETLRAMMNYAALRWEEPVKVIAWKTFRQKEAKAREIFISPEEARRLMELLPSHIALAFAFSIYTGCRLNEMETLIWERVDWERGAATVVTKAQGSEPVTRVLWLSAKALVILQNRLLAALEPHQSRANGDLSTHIAQLRVFDLTNRRKHWEKARVAIGRTDLHWHDIRACAATWSRQYAKADLRLISEALGHSDTKVTERYARVERREIIEMLDQLPDISIGGAHLQLS